MKPNARLITLGNNRARIGKLLRDLVLTPRIRAIRWSRITRQTPNIKIGYPGQHFASLITGMIGEGTGARDNDLADGSEVKSCSRIDQLDKCNACEAPVARIESKCPDCGSINIQRKKDSKWLFTIRTRAELNTLLHEVGRIVFVFGDYPNFANGDFGTLRFQAFEIWPGHPRNRRFGEIMTNYYKKIYLEHKKRDANKTPAPKNFWPDQYQFYICNPIRTFLCEVRNANKAPRLSIKEYVEPEVNRKTLPSIPMPKGVLKKSELNFLLSRASTKELRDSLPAGAFVAQSASKTKLLSKITEINETLRKYLDLRDTDKISVAKRQYKRRHRDK